MWLQQAANYFVRYSKGPADQLHLNRYKLSFHASDTNSSVFLLYLVQTFIFTFSSNMITCFETCDHIRELELPLQVRTQLSLGAVVSILLSSSTGTNLVVGVEFGHTDIDNFHHDLFNGLGSVCQI